MPGRICTLRRTRGGDEDEREIGEADNVEMGGVVDVFIDSLRQIRSVLVG